MTKQSGTSQPSAFLPDFLQDYASMLAFLNEQALKSVGQTSGKETSKSQANKAKGDFFEHLASEVIAEHPEIDLPASKIKCEFTGGSWEEGVDLIFKDENNDKVLLYAQVKWAISQVDHLDIILSKFENFYKKTHSQEVDLSNPSQQLSIPSLLEQSKPFQDRQDDNSVEFAIITLKEYCGTIVDRYKKQDRSSKEFYNFLISKNALHIIDGNQVFNLIKTHLSRLCGILPDVDLKLESKPIRVGDVAIGVISAQSLAECFSKTRESLFFENVRLFKGEDSGRKQRGRNREPVNSEILKTMLEEPGKMLSRNNGITFRAEKIVAKDDQGHLFLKKANIVNGCQTTYMVVKAFDEFPESVKDAKILVKIVETESSWDVAEAANFQNKINQIDLKLAKYLRPQIAQRAGMFAGINIEGNTNSSLLLEKLSYARASYEDVKILFLGLFSRSPGNTIAANYTEFRYSLLEEFLKLEQDLQNESLLKLIIEIQLMSDQISEEVAQKFSLKYLDLFKRFLEKGSYKAFLTITAGCIAMRCNIYQEDWSISELTVFLESLISKKTDFIDAYRVSFMTLASKILDWDKSKDENLKNMYSAVESAGTMKNFGNLLSLGIESFNQTQK